MLDGNIQPLGVRTYDYIPLPLSSEQTSAVQKYTTNTLWAKKERVIEFYQGERGVLFLKDVSRSVIEGAAIAARAAFVARIVYEVCVLIIYKWPARIAYYLGWTVLEAASVRRLTSTIRFTEDKKSDEYREWRLEKMNTTTDQIFRDTIKREDLNLLGYICPISQHLIKIPYTTKLGRHTFEKDFILDWVRRVTPMVTEKANRAATEEEREEILKQTSPFRDEYIQEQDLRYDWEYHSSLCDRINTLVNEYNARNERRLPQEAIEGLQKLKNSVTLPATKVADELILIANKMFCSGQISEQDFLRKTKAVNTHYAPFRSPNPQEMPQMPEAEEPPTTVEDR